MIIDNYILLNKTSFGAIVRSGFILNNRLDITFKALVNPTYLGNKEENNKLIVKIANVGISYLLSNH